MFFRDCALVCCVCALWACDEQALTPPASRVLAVVGGRAITAADYARRVSALPSSARPTDRAGRQKLLAELIDDAALAAEARRRGLDRDPAVRAALAERLSEAFAERIARALPGPEAASSAQVAAYYRDNQRRYSISERRRVEAWSFADLAGANAAKAKLARGARAISTPTPAKPVDGDPGWQDLGNVGPPGDPSGDDPRVPQALRAAVFSLGEVGDVSAPIALGRRFWLVRYAGRTPPILRTLEQEARNIRRRIAERRLSDAQRDAVATLRATTPVAIDEAALGEVELPPDDGYDPARWRRR